MKAPIQIYDGDHGEFVGVAGDNYRVVVSGEQTGNRFSVFDMLIPPGGGPLPHAHPDTEEWFYILEGELEYKTENGSQVVKTGGFVYIPFGGAIHSFKNISGKMAHVLCVVTPAGLENFFREFGAPVSKGEFPPLPEINAEFKEKVARLNKKYGQKIFPPDYLD